VMRTPCSAACAFASSSAMSAFCSRTKGNCASQVATGGSPIQDLQNCTLLRPLAA
jgi:hypothetical protein